MNPEQVLALLLAAIEVEGILTDLAKQNGFTIEDINKADAERKKAIAEFKKTAGLQ